LIVQVYIYLQEGRTEGYMPAGYLRQEVKALQEQTGPAIAGGRAAARGSDQCTKFKPSCHRGGWARCPFKEFDNAQAKVMGRDTARQIQEDPNGDRDEIYWDAIEDSC
jgi:hypothetical protein